MMKINRVCDSETLQAMNISFKRMSVLYIVNSYKGAKLRFQEISQLRRGENCSEIF